MLLTMGYYAKHLDAFAACLLSVPTKFSHSLVLICLANVWHKSIMHFQHVSSLGPLMSSILQTLV